MNLSYQKRTKEEKNQEIRESGFIPAVFYGPKEETVSIKIEMNPFLKVWEEAGESSVISLTGEFGDKDALIHEVDLDPVKDTPIHIDFYVVEKGKKVKVSVPIEFIGVSPAVKDLGGTLIKILHEVEVEAMPKDLPQQIEADISLITDFDTHLSVKDLKIPNGVTIEADMDEVVASVSAGQEESSESVKPDISTVEVAKKGKKEEEAESAE